jgi:hypothetical protein
MLGKPSRKHTCGSGRWLSLASYAESGGLKELWLLRSAPDPSSGKAAPTPTDQPGKRRPRKGKTTTAAVKFARRKAAKGDSTGLLARGANPVFPAGFGDDARSLRLPGARRWKGAVRANVGAGVGGAVADAAVSTVLDVAKVFAVDVLRVGEATGEALGEGAGAGRAALAVVTDVGRGAAVAAGAGTVVKAVSRGIGLIRASRVAEQGLASATVGSQATAGTRISEQVALGESKQPSWIEELYRQKGEPLAGQKEALRYPREKGVPKEEQRKILSAFSDPREIKVWVAGAGDYGIRYYVGNANARGRWLFDTFPASRESLALDPKLGYTGEAFKQWRIRAGTVIIEGPAARQGPYPPGGKRQFFVLDLEDLLEP